MQYEAKCVVLFEPDVWRFAGIARFLSDCGVRVSGGSPCEQPLFAQTLDRDPDAVMLAHELVDRYGTEIIGRIRAAYSSAAILVHGETECLDVTASLLALGVQGYFVLSSPQSLLLKALSVVGTRGIWAPREAVVLMAQRGFAAAAHPPPREDESDHQVVLKLLLEGLSNKEIATRLGVAEVTVKTRLTRLYKRYGVRTRLQLLSAAIRQHLIDETA